MQIQTIEDGREWAVVVNDSEIFRGTAAEAARYADKISRKAMTNDDLEKIQRIEKDTGEKLFVEHLGEFRFLVLRREANLSDSIFFHPKTDTLSVNEIGDVKQDSKLARIIASWLA